MILGTFDGSPFPEPLESTLRAAEQAGRKAFARRRPRTEVDRFRVKYACINGHWRMGYDAAAREEQAARLRDPQAQAAPEAHD